MVEEIQELKNKINEIERKYSFIKDYKLISTILDMFDIEKLVMSVDEVNNNKSIYICETDYQHKKITIYRQINSQINSQKS